VQIKIVRSARRKKTIGARMDGDVLIIQAPARMTDAELAPYVETLRKKLELTSRRRVSKSDLGLLERAERLNQRYFAGKLKIATIRFVSNQHRRFGSCTSAQGTIRISDRLRKAPDWVLDYVLVHEMAHLIEPNHSARFNELVERYPRTERARGYLIALGMQVDPDAEPS
jgi:predicted metal-dependent hydrolase